MKNNWVFQCFMLSKVLCSCVKSTDTFRRCEEGYTLKWKVGARGLLISLNIRNGVVLLVEQIRSDVFNDVFVKEERHDRYSDGHSSIQHDV